MCDVYSLGSAGSDFLGGVAGAMDARGAAKFEAAQLESMKILVAAKGSREESAIRGSYGEHMKANIAAAAISGFGMSTFDTVNDGNIKDMQKQMEGVARSVELEKVNLDVQKMEVLLEGKRKAQASLFSGINSALSTLKDAEDSYQEYHTGETRGEALKRSMRKRRV